MAEQKEHPATAKQRERFRGKGEMVQVKELGQALVLALGGAVVASSWGSWSRLLGGTMRRAMAAGRRGGAPSWPELAHIYWQVVQPVLAMALLVAVATGIARQRGGIAWRSPSFDLGRVNPLARLGQLFGSGGRLGALGGAALKMLVVASVSVTLLVERVPGALKHAPASLGGAARDGMGLVATMFVRGSVALVLLGVWDSWRSWVRLERRMSMSAQEVRDEVKEQQGDPSVRGRIKSKARELAKKRMLVRVPKAQVVVVNPTHLAVALAYDAKRMAAPVVVAKGAGAMAERIRAIARRHGVPVVHQPPLARMLYDRVEVAKAVPRDLYQATAVVLAHVFRLRRHVA